MWVALVPAEFTLTAIIPTLPPVVRVPLFASSENPPAEPLTPLLTEIERVYVVPGTYEEGWPDIDTVALDP